MAKKDFQVRDRIILLQTDLIKIGEQMAELSARQGFSVRDVGYVALKTEYAAIRREILDLKGEL